MEKYLHVVIKNPYFKCNVLSKNAVRNWSMYINWLQNKENAHSENLSKSQNIYTNIISDAAVLQLRLIFFFNWIYVSRIHNEKQQMDFIGSYFLTF